LRNAARGLSLHGTEAATLARRHRQPSMGRPIPGRVVRHLEEGFAMEFTRLQHPDSLEENVAAQ
jgi:hypothetical protein